MWNADAGVDFATAGGQYGGKLSANRTAIDGDTRWSARVQVGADSAFRKTARDISPRDGIFDGVGFVSALDGGEIDPALSLAAGEIVTAAAIPHCALSGVPTLGDFDAIATALHPGDRHEYQTLQPSPHNASLDTGHTHHNRR